MLKPTLICQSEKGIPLGGPSSLKSGNKKLILFWLVSRERLASACFLQSRTQILDSALLGSVHVHLSGFCTCTCVLLCTSAHMFMSLPLQQGQMIDFLSLLFYFLFASRTYTMSTPTVQYYSIGRFGLTRVRKLPILFSITAIFNPPYRIWLPILPRYHTSRAGTYRSRSSADP